MKKFLYVFILLMSVNLCVPVIYYKIYYQKGSDNIINEDSQQITQPDGQTDSETSNITYSLYNLETQELEEMDLISFLVGSAACEMPAYYEMEAIKAQMIACHSYYLYCTQNGVPNDDLNLSFDQRYMQKYASKAKLQEYWGTAFNENYQKFLNCANEVKDLIVKYNSQVALTTYYALSCGATQSSEDEWGMALDYLVSVNSEKDALSDDYIKIKELTTQEMYDRLMTGFAGLDISIENPQDWIKDIQYNAAGYVTQVSINSSTVSGRDFRKSFDLPSSCFMVFYEDDKFSIATKGYGHGVGMSQFGANQLSQEGKTYKEILAYYYPNTYLESVNT